MIVPVPPTRWPSAEEAARSRLFSPVRLGRSCVASSRTWVPAMVPNMESILSWNTKEGQIFRGGSGSGVNLSKIRGSMETLTKGGTASGPVSFMRGADAWAGTIKSGGKTRRAAKMVILDVDHPDIREFIWCKAKKRKKPERYATQASICRSTVTASSRFSIKRKQLSSRY